MGGCHEQKIIGLVDGFNTGGGTFGLRRFNLCIEL